MFLFHYSLKFNKISHKFKYNKIEDSLDSLDKTNLITLHKFNLLMILM